MLAEEVLSSVTTGLDPRNINLGEDDGVSDADSDGVEWLSPADALRVESDPLFGLRPEDLRPRFWESGDAVCSTTLTKPALHSPSTASMRKIADKEGFSVDDIISATDVPAISPLRDKVMASTPPSVMDRSIFMARKIVSTLFEPRQPKGKPWRGPLPNPRVSPPMTLGACLVKDLSKGLGCRRPEMEEGVRILNQDPQSTDAPNLGRHGPNYEVSIWTGTDWARFRRNALGRLLSRRGTLPQCYRHNTPVKTLAPILDGDCTYAAIVQGRAMDSGGASGAGYNGGGHNSGHNGGLHGGFNGGGNNGGFPGPYMGANGWGSVSWRL